jgi:hypothetical protein
MSIALKTTDKNLADDLQAVKIDGLTVHPRIAFKDSGSVPVVIDTIWQFTINHASELALALFASWLYDKIKRNPKEKTIINGQTISGENIQITQIKQIFVNNIIIQKNDNGKP